MAARLADLIDRLSEGAGALIRWLVLVMVLLGAFNAIARARYTNITFAAP